MKNILNLNNSTSRLVIAATIGLMVTCGQASAQSVAVPTDEAPAEEAPAEEAPQDIVVTGTRIMSGTTAPTPLTTISTETLQQTTPSNIPDALNKLPLFQGSQSARSVGSGRTLQASNVLNLRNFGAQRTLVLFNGHRVPPSNADGTVNVDIIPQMLIERVDTVTGGASAVYGSDAVSGVINFILDTDFTGIKTDVNAGISTYGDGERYRLGIAAGQSLFEGRGHVLASFRMTGQSRVDNFDRELGRDVWVLTGNGTEARPFTKTKNTRRGDSTFGGLVQGCSAPCPPNRSLHFVSDGVLAPFYPGELTGTNNQNRGGDGAYGPYGTAVPENESVEAFGRFSYDVTDDINFYVQGAYSTYKSIGWHFPTKLTPGNGQASTFFKNNPFLTPAVRAQLGDNGLSDSTNTFQLGTYITSTGREGQNGTEGSNKYYNVEAGLSGTLGDFRWDAFYSHGSNEQKVLVFNNPNYQRQFAALDAVLDSNGIVRCYAATQAATAAQYADCVPLNAFGPTAITTSAQDWFVEDTYYKQFNIMDNVGGSITGTAFENWAGSVQFAVSGEARWQSYKIRSSADPAATVDCTGLRICNPNLALWAQPVQASVAAKSNVWEIAGELEVPLLRDMPFAQNLSVNLAGRYTDYSTSGSVKTWKIGVDWQVIDDLRLRGTISRDIRAPTLDDLYKPPSASVTGFNDLHTGVSDTLFFTVTGNPNLIPEIARTYTAGVVFTPDFLPGFTASVDYYRFSMDNAIGEVAAENNTVQRICSDSNGTHPFCELFTRPFPYSDHSPANFPTSARTLKLNAAHTRVEGVDFEANYGFEALGGSWGTRIFANYQPVNEQVPFEGSSVVVTPQSKWRATSMVSYKNGPIGANLQYRWLSKYDLRTLPDQVFVDRHQKSFNTVDLNIDWTLPLGGSESVAYFTVENLFNAKPEPFPATGSIGIGYPAPPGYDVLGRYFTIGIRSRW